MLRLAAEFQSQHLVRVNANVNLRITAHKRETSNALYALVRSTSRLSQ